MIYTSRVGAAQSAYVTGSKCTLSQRGQTLDNENLDILRALRARQRHFDAGVAKCIVLNVSIVLDLIMEGGENSTVTAGRFLLSRRYAMSTADLIRAYCEPRSRKPC